MTIRGRHLANHHSENATLAAELAEIYLNLAEYVQGAVDTLQPTLAQARLDVGADYLPTLDAASLADLSLRSAYKKLERRDPLRAMAQEAKVLAQSIAAIQQDDRYQRRQWLVGPQGTLLAALTEAQSLLEPWEEACAEFEKHEHFLTLIELRYDTPEYEISWLQARYWTYWAAGDKICRELEMADFGDDVLPAYQKVEVERRRWRAQVATAQRKVNEVHELVREHDQATARIPRLPELYLLQCQQAVATFLEQADLTLLAQWNRDHAVPNRAVTMGLRRLAGLEAKVDALSELRNRGVLPFAKDLQARETKYLRKVVKFRRDKHIGAMHDDRNADRGFAQKAPKYRLRAEQAAALVQRILDYSDYESFDVAISAPEMWFMQMTGKKPSRLFPGLRGWYDRRPDLRPVRSRDDREQPQADAVAAFTETDDLGYLS